MICTRHVNKHFGRHQALKNISFDIAKGEIVGFLGQNGAGKTTLMRILTSYLAASSGEVVVAGIDIKKDSLAIRRKIGYLPENPPLYMDMIVRDYLKYAAELKDVASRQQKFRVDRALEQCRLASVARRPIATLSKGYKQRVGIAQATINDPEILILDEPTNGLDPVQIIEVRNLIQSLEKERTVIVSTHYLTEIEQMAKRILILKDGEIIADDSLVRLLESSGTTRKMVVRTQGDKDAITESIKTTRGVQKVSVQSLKDVHTVKIQITEPWVDCNALIRKILKDKGSILEIKELPPNLEKVFLNLHR